MPARKHNGSSLDGQVENLPRDFLDTEIIADPLNGLIRISIFEKRIIGCPEFQRLRRIKQLGFANLVYPAAEYSRFVHSIGACHQSKNIVDILNENLRNSLRYRRWRVSGKDEGPEPDWTSVAISSFERVIIATAALLHDVSHGPFSHEIEGILDENGAPIIPDHDDYERNPALFLYLFDREVSKLAAILFHFNQPFVTALMRDAEAVKDKTAPGCDCRLAIKSLVSNKVITPDGMIRIGDDGPVRPIPGRHAESRFTELPLLPVLIFEILLFENQDEWLSLDDRKRILGVKDGKAQFGVRVRTGWEGGDLVWRPLPGWFRAYRKDIIGNTICADLIDYVSRDGYHTGIVSTMDLKFLDRMVIARATLPPIGPDGRSLMRPSANVVPYKEIPLACEHIVFDIYDHKRGFIRQSVLTEILAYLQGRYLLCERVYVHRVVEAARTMLQEAIAILASIQRETDAARPLLSIRDLHALDDSSMSPTAPVSDDGLLNWIRALPALHEATYEKNRAGIDRAIELAAMLQDRRVYREAIIYDGIHGFDPPGSLTGPKENCRALEAALLTNPAMRANVRDTLDQLDESLREALETETWNADGQRRRIQLKTSVLLAVRKWGKRYKPPLVLIARPFKEKNTAHSALDIQPLLDCEDPPNIKKQLDALKDSYDSLWKVYVFVHPVFHDQKFLTAHDEIDKQFSDFVAQQTGSRWHNAIDFEQLLREPIDNESLLAQAEATPLRDVPLSIELIMSLLKPLTTQDVENRTRLQVHCELFVQEAKKLPMDKQATVRTELMKLPTYRPKLPAIVNRFSAEQIERKLRRILDQARGIDAAEV